MRGYAELDPHRLRFGSTGGQQLQPLKRPAPRVPNFELELFHEGELNYCNRQDDPVQHLGSRFAAKEAVIKALGIDGWEPLEVEIVGGGEQTSVLLHGDVAERAAALGVEVTVSLTHLPAIAGAVALATPRAGKPR